MDAELQRDEEEEVARPPPPEVQAPVEEDDEGDHEEAVAHPRVDREPREEPHVVEVYERADRPAHQRDRRVQRDRSGRGPCDHVEQELEAGVLGARELVGLRGRRRARGRQVDGRDHQGHRDEEGAQDSHHEEELRPLRRRLPQGPWNHEPSQGGAVSLDSR